ncbi:MAG TPA: response regulator FixJ [Rhizomicrobium sp.]|nr:response regulator FixJ [Rhizomicrobium sp.]
MSTEPTIFIIDDEPSVRESLRALLESVGHRVKDYGSAHAFLADHPTHDGCAISDIRMPEMDGLELQEEIARRGLGIPVIIMTGHGDVPLAVRAMKAGAIDFLEKPFDDETMLGSVRRALEAGRQKHDQLAEARAAQDLLSLLTPRERHVLDQLVAGRSNKVAAYELGISPRTIEIHRARIMDKMHARSLSDLVRTALAAAKPAGGPI